MAGIKSLVALLTTLLTINSMSVAAPDRKCVPMKWESRVIAHIGQNNKGNSVAYEVYGSVSYDYEKGLEALGEYVYSNNMFAGFYKYIMTQDATYFVNTTDASCVKLPKSNVVRVCTDFPGLTYRYTAKLGSEVTDTYSIEAAGVTLTYLTMFRDPFIPGVQNTQTSAGGVDQMTALQTVNVTEGIKDPGVFDLPSYCKSDMPITEDHVGLQFLKGILIGMK